MADHSVAVAVEYRGEAHGSGLICEFPFEQVARFDITMPEQLVAERLVIVDVEQERTPGPVLREQPTKELGIDDVVDAS